MLVPVIESPIPTQSRWARWWVKEGNATTFLKWVRLSPTDTFRSRKDLIGWYGMASSSGNIKILTLLLTDFQLLILGGRAFCSPKRMLG